MIEQRTISSARCDGCGRLSYSEDGIHPGYAGTVIHHHPDGGSGGEWFACRSRCIGPAVRTAVDRDDHERQETP